jgi:hypothetical protein
MPMDLPQGMKALLKERIPVRVLLLDITIEPNIYHFATRKIRIGTIEYAPYLVQSGEYAAFGGTPADRVVLQIQNIDKAMSSFYHQNQLESAPAEVAWYFPEFDFRWTMIKGRVSLVSLTGQVAEFEVRSRFDPATLRIPKRIGQALCPWATAGMFNDGPVSDPEAQCPYRTEGIPGFTNCPGRLSDCQDRGMFNPAQSKYYFGGFPIQSGTTSGVRQVPSPPVPFVNYFNMLAGYWFSYFFPGTGWTYFFQDLTRVGR